MGQHDNPRMARMRRTLVAATTAVASIVGITAVAAGPAAASTPPVSGTTVMTEIGDDGLAPIAAVALDTLQTYQRTKHQSALNDYITIRNAIAGEVANRLGVSSSRLIGAWHKADYPHQAALMAAMTQLGVPYRSMQSNPGRGFDCSGLTTFAWGVAGVSLIRQSGGQINAAASRTIDTAMAGDLMYYPGHAMMWLGVDRAMIHSPYSGKSVEVDVLSSKRSLRFGNPIG